MIKWLNAVVLETCQAIQAKRNKNTPVEIMKLYIENNYMNKISRIEISNAVHMSPDYAGRLFKKEMGTTIQDYLINVRIQKAKELMRTTQYPISEIATMVGYEQFSHFSYSFHNIEHMSPRQYRNTCRE